MTTYEPYAEKLAQIPQRKHTVVINGAEVSYWEYGNPSSPVDIVMIHGFRGDHHGLEPFVAELGNTFHVIIPDLPGFGRSQKLSTDSSIDSYARWLSDFWSVVKVPSSTAILGHSFGSIVVSAAVSQGLAVHKVILVNPIAANALSGPRAFMTKLAVAYYKTAAFLPEKLGNALLRNSMIVQIMSSTMAKTKDKDLRKWIHSQHKQFFSVFASRTSLLEAFEASVSHDVSEYTSKIKQKVLLIVAEKDDITALPQQFDLVGKFAHGQIEVIPDVGHLVHYEAAYTAAKLISTFIRKDS